jgi:hypothetical protein
LRPVALESVFWFTFFECVPGLKGAPGRRFARNREAAARAADELI